MVIELNKTNTQKVIKYINTQSKIIFSCNLLLYQLIRAKTLMI